MEAAGVAKQQKNPGSVVGIVRELDALIGLSPQAMPSARDGADVFSS